MKAMTIWQPYAGLIAAGFKRYETRSFRPPASLIGQRIAIHAAARPCKRMEFGRIVDSLCKHTPGVGYMDELPLGVVVATAIIDSVHRAEDIRDILRDNLRNDELAVGDWYGTPDKPNRFGWLLRDVRAFGKPVPAKGKQGWWNWEPPVPRCGDTVLHRPSGEEWHVAYADPETDNIAWAGWPNGLARLSDCELILACSDEYHRGCVVQWRGVTDDSRRDHVMARYGAALGIAA